MEVIAGIDIGGTKCAVSFIHMNGDEVEFLSKEKRPTDESHPDEMVQSFVNEIAEKLNVSSKTVDYRIQQALKLLRVELKDYLPLLMALVRIV